jgi:hypothetical protein
MEKCHLGWILASKCAFLSTNKLSWVLMNKHAEYILTKKGKGKRDRERKYEYLGQFNEQTT